MRRATKINHGLSSFIHFLVLVLISFPRPNHGLFMFSLSWFLSLDNPPHPPSVINHRPRITVGFSYINLVCSYSIEILLMETIEPRPSPQGGEALLREKMAAVWAHFHLLPIILISIIFMHIRSFSAASTFPGSGTHGYFSLWPPPQWWTSRI